MTQKGGEDSNYPTAKTAQQGPQGAFQTHKLPLIYQGSNRPNFAGCLHTRRRRHDGAPIRPVFRGASWCWSSCWLWACW